MTALEKVAVTGVAIAFCVLAILFLGAATVATYLLLHALRGFPG
jgi:hypothetical protein